MPPRRRYKGHHHQRITRPGAALGIYPELLFLFRVGYIITAPRRRRRHHRSHIFREEVGRSARTTVVIHVPSVRTVV